MDTKKIILTLPRPILKKLEQDKKKFAYNSIQERITEILRNKYFRELSGGTKRGRPKKIRPENILTRKKIFSKKGIAIDI